jgi:hypothetical protein
VRPSLRYWAGFGLAGLALAASACSSARKKEPELSELRGKKVALVEIDGESTARKVVEVALINQLVSKGTFSILAKQDVDAARTAPEQDTTDWQGIARRAGAEYALRAHVLEFDTREDLGYSSETVQDSVLAQERGDDGTTERLYRVRALTGKVRIELEFARLADGDLRKAVAERERRIIAEDKTGRADLPPRLRYIETLCNEAFGEFFERYK